MSWRKLILKIQTIRAPNTDLNGLKKGVSFYGSKVIARNLEYRKVGKVANDTERQTVGIASCNTMMFCRKSHLRSMELIKSPIVCGSDGIGKK